MLFTGRAFEKRSTEELKSKFKSRKDPTMKTNFTRIVAIATLGLIAICATASSASAQNAFQGKFTLPNDVRWANASLPAGDYTFSLSSATMSGHVFLQGPNGGAFILTSVTDKRDEGDSSKLTIERRGGISFVRSMYLADLGVELTYPAPKTPKKDVELAQGPVSIEQVLIAKK
jgi:hypothetical protein